MSAEQRVVAPRQSARSEEHHPWQIWTIEAASVPSHEAFSSESQTQSLLTFTVAISSQAVSAGHPANSPSSASRPAQSSMFISNGATSKTFTDNASSTPISPVPATLSSDPRPSPSTVDSSSLSTAENTTLFGISSTSAALYPTTSYPPPSQTAEIGPLKVQSDPATHGILAASIVSSVLVVLAMAAVLIWWLTKRAKKGYRYGLMQETKKPMF